MVCRETKFKNKGWVNNYTRFNKWKMLDVFHYLNDLLKKWMMNKYKLRSKNDVLVKPCVVVDPALIFGFSFSANHSTVWSDHHHLSILRMDVLMDVLAAQLIAPLKTKNVLFLPNLSFPTLG